MEEYARSRGVARRAIQQAIVSGVIKLIDGKVDPEQADASWGVLRRASRLGQYQHGEAGKRAAQSKVAVALARLRLMKQRCDTTRERYVDRAEAIDTGRREAEFVIAMLEAAPADYADTLARELEIRPEVTRRILERFITLALIEIGDLPRAAVRDAERA